MGYREAVRWVYWVISTQLGFDIRRLVRSLRGVPAYCRDYRAFSRQYSGPMEWQPCLYDRYDEGGATRNEYFLQDLFVARWIHEENPVRHVDVGSRVDGFVAHVASFREIEVLDVRNITAKIPGVTFRQVDFTMTNPVAMETDGYCDSVSCLHAIEHFGLGRYGDSIDPQGYRRGIANLSGLLNKGGGALSVDSGGKATGDFQCQLDI